MKHPRSRARTLPWVIASVVTAVAATGTAPPTPPELAGKKKVWVSGYGDKSLTKDSSEWINREMILVQKEATFNAAKVYDTESGTYMNVGFDGISNTQRPDPTPQERQAVHEGKGGGQCMHATGMGPGAITKAAEVYSKNPASDSDPSGRGPASSPVESPAASVGAPPLTGSTPESAVKPGGPSPDAPTLPPLPGFGSPALDTPQSKTLDSIVDATEESRKGEILASAQAILEKNADDAHHDATTLNTAYQNVSPEVLGERLARAQATLGDTAEDLMQSDGLSSGEKARFKNVFLNARDKASLGLQALQREKDGQSLYGEDSPFGGLAGPAGALGAKASQVVADLLGYAPKKPGGTLGSDSSASEAPAATSNEALVNRTALLQGLAPAEKATTLAKLRLLERPVLNRPGSAPREIPLLHNGYIFGGSSTGTDCSAFVTAALPVDMRKGRFTTLDFRSMWLYLSTGAFPKPPRYVDERGRVLREVAQSFLPVNLYVGDRLETGDLLVQRMLWETAGHVFIVRKFNPNTLVAEVIEAAQSAGTIRERTFSLSLAPTNVAERPIRPGLFGLRLRPQDNRGCKYKDRAPAKKGDSA